jgi:DNA-binding transcriptional LysR family regulator
LLDGARRLLADSRALVAQARGEARQHEPLRLSHFGTLAAQHFSPFLRKMLLRFPGLRLEVEEEMPAMAIKAVKAGKLDAAFTGVPAGNSLRGLETRLAQIAPQDIILPATHRFAKRRSVRLEELGDERWCVWDETEFPGFGRAAIDQARRAGFRMQVASAGNSLASLFIRVASGEFIGYAPPFARQLPHNGTVFIPLDPPTAMDMPVKLVWRRDSAYHEILSWLGDSLEAAIPAERIKTEWLDAGTGGECCRRRLTAAAADPAAGAPVIADRQELLASAGDAG